ncbi:hypothetical protein KC909_05075 [Candidatus Dojkabacteria bacterium]|uniref:Uncharacterized protein n=1 Tax=Candidatus Dojkabacteria bacterium TaxID=2099670 RepID=A0A955L6P3_9BACT|nr:hypothetical protein [Candidatus Dojkabacteria bacterium]
MFYEIQGPDRLIPMPVKTEFAELGGTPCYLFDPHNEAFKYWFERFYGSNALVVHVDGHSDMADTVSAQLSPDQNIDIYTEYLQIDNFVCAAAHHQVVSKMYHLMYSYLGDGLRITKYDHLETQVIDDTVLWQYDQYNPPRATETELIEDVNTTQLPIIWDFDLDAFLCIDEILDAEENYIAIARARIDDMMDFLSRLKRPDLVTIAQSTYPDEWTPRDYVDEIKDYFTYRLAELLQ